MKRNLFLTMMLCLALGLNAKVKLPALVGDNMVLQQQTEVKLWGTAEPKTQVRVTTSWDGKSCSVRADKEGRWLVRVTTPQGGFTPYEITFDDGEPLTVRNVLVGEVWLASGQSNMEMPLKGFGGCCVQNGQDEIAFSARNTGVRFFTVPKRQSYEPQADCDGHWALSNPDEAPEFSATAYHFATTLTAVLQMPVGIVCCAYGGSTVESWTNRELLETYSDISLKPEDIEKMTAWERPLLMYNGMLRACENYTVRGIIWYQGCSNVGRHETYARRLANMVELWRKEWGLGELPFYFVEIAPYQYEGSQKGKAAFLREAQFKAQALIPNSGMVSTNDLVEPFEYYNIHPRRKTQVGRRLAYMALNRTYDRKQFVCDSPQYKALEIEGDKALVSFDKLVMGICRNYDLRGFEVAGEDRVFHPADEVTLRWQTNHIIVSSKAVPRPVAVRYCFRDFQIGTMYGGNELPLIPFRTDDWDDVY